MLERKVSLVLIKKFIGPPEDRPTFHEIYERLHKMAGDVTQVAMKSVESNNQSDIYETN
jgi:hypothetical protein